MAFPVTPVEAVDLPPLNGPIFLHFPRSNSKESSIGLFLFFLSEIGFIATNNDINASISMLSLIILYFCILNLT